MMRFGVGGKVVLGLLACVLTRDVAAGSLRKFAEKATNTPAASEKPPPAKQSRSSSSDALATSTFGSGTYPSDSSGSSFLGGFYAWLITAPFQYRYDEPTSVEEGGDEGFAPGPGAFFPRHWLGEATVPFVRVDYNRQTVDSDVDANDIRVEVGYKLLAFHGRTTMYSNKMLGEDLDINQFYGVLRYGGYRADFVPGTFEAGLGLGLIQIKFEDALGSIDDSTIAFMLLLKYYPVQWFGVEFRPAWYSFAEDQIGDYDLSASVGFRYVQLRGGYRWLGFSDSGENLDGPYAGVSLSF